MANTEGCERFKGFLGLMEYYKRFVKDYSKITKPLTQLLKKGSFKWGKKAQKVFDALRVTMTTLPILLIPNF